MFNFTFRQVAILVITGASLCVATAKQVAVADWVPVAADEVCDDPCDEPPPCGACLKRKLKLHCVYCRRAFTCRYISLPYTQPNSTMYYSPAAAGAAAYGMPNCPPVGPATGGPATGGPAARYSNGYGYGAYGYGTSPAYASPGTVFIR